jgi:hypothetical protein
MMLVAVKILRNVVLGVSRSRFNERIEALTPAERLRCMVAGGFRGRTGPVIVIIATAISPQAQQVQANAVIACTM